MPLSHRLFLLLFAPLFGLLPVSKGYGQEVVHRRLSASDGLPSSEIHQVCTDAQGYVWISTNSGIARFDGKTFHTFTTGEGLPDNEVQVLAPTPLGDLWFSTGKGIPGRIVQGQAETYHKIPRLARHNIASVYYDQNNRIWFSSYDQWVFQTRNDSILGSYQTPGQVIMNFAENNKGQLVASGNLGGSWYSFSSGKWKKESEEIFKSREAMPQPLVWHAPTKQWLMAYGGGLYAIDPGLEPLPLWKTQAPDLVVQALLVDAVGDLWLGTSMGVVQLGYDSQEGWFTKSHFLKELRVQSLALDFEGNIWAATPGSGLYFVPQARTLRFGRSNRPAANHITSLLDLGREGLAVGADDGGVFKWKNGNMQTLLEGKAGYVSSRVNQLIQHSDGSIWMATERGIFRWKSGRISLVLNRPGRSLAEGMDQEVWVGSGNSLVQLNAQGKVLNRQLIGRIGSLEFDVAQEGLLYASEWGLSLFRNGVNRFWVDGSTFKNQRISSICSDPKRGLMWVSTLGAGLFGLKGKEAIYHFHSGVGLASNMVNHVFLDDQGNLWVSGRKGLDRIHPESNQMRHFGEAEGLLAEEINQVLVQGDSVWAATNEGLNLFVRSRMRKQSPPPPIHLAGVKINDEYAQVSKLEQLDHNSNNLELELHGISYSNPEGISYTYRLDGLDSNWYQTKSNIINFAGLPPGDYHFTAYALDSYGQRSLQPIDIRISIQPAYWQTMLFRVFMVLLAVGLVALFILLRVKYIKKREREKTEYNKVLNELKLTALKAQMNPHFLFNSLGSIQNLINTDRKKEANQYLSKFARLLRMILDQSDQKDVTLMDKIALLELYLGLETLRFSNRFQYHILVPEELDQTSIRIPPMIIQPFVENAIKHGLLPKKEGAELLISFETKPNRMLYCLIEDNGIGRVKREALKEGSQQSDYISKGIQITKDRLQLVNELRDRPANFKITDLYDEDGSPRGTRVEFFIPYD